MNENSGETLGGANVILEGVNGTTANFDGEFSI